ncbi:MAG: hypothetical protein IPN98_12945 [Propionivibrio sp.]|nr:hypothetical protein [Propionivibrio sp.]
MKLTPSGRHSRIENGWAGYRLFLMGLLLTAIGSSYYHLDPDNARLVWDRLPIALAGGGFACRRLGRRRQRSSSMFSAFLAVAAILSVAWWYFTEQAGNGDLRPYLLLQGLPILLIPLWQWIYDMPRHDRRVLP